MIRHSAIVPCRHSSTKSRKLLAQRHEVGDLCFYLCQMFPSDPVDIVARPILPIGQVQEIPDLLDGEAQVTASADEA